MYKNKDLLGVGFVVIGIGLVGVIFFKMDKVVIFIWEGIIIIVV